jgi:hypothetical protein
MLKSYYKVLGLDYGAGYAEIREAYVRMVLRHPPEDFPHEFQAIKTAYDNLTLNGQAYQTFRDAFYEANTQGKLFERLFADSVELPADGGDLKSLVGSRLTLANQEEAWDYLTLGIKTDLSYSNPADPAPKGKQPDKAEPAPELDGRAASNLTLEDLLSEFTDDEDTFLP